MESLYVTHVETTLSGIAEKKLQNDCELVDVIISKNGC